MIYALANAKGGVGKSTLAVHLAVWLREQGAQVGLVDSDAQESSSIWLKEAEPGLKTFRLLAKEDLLGQIPRIAEKFDHLVIDGPGGLSEATRTILLLADLTLLPCGPSLLDIRAANGSIDVVHQVQRIRGGPPKALFVPNKLQERYRLSAEFMEAAKSLDIPTTSPLHLLMPYADAVGQATVVWRMKANNARKAANEITTLFKEITTDDTDSKTTDERSVANF